MSLRGTDAIGPEASKVIIGAIFRPGAKQDISELLRAFAKLQPIHYRATLMLSVGEEDHEHAHHYVHDLGLKESTVILSETSDFAALLPNFDIFALPTSDDSVPLALLEALAAGLPIATTDTASIRRIMMKESAGYLVKPGDLHHLAASIRTLVDDAGKRKQMGTIAQLLAHATFGGYLSAGRLTYGYDRPMTPSGTRRSLKKLLLAFISRQKLLWRGSKHAAQFALTFDDGPDPIYTPRILDMLREHKLRATFFVVGNRMEEYQSVARRILDEGHELANHSYTHRRLEQCSMRDAIGEVRRTDKILTTQDGRPTHSYRPPFGRISRQSLLAAWSQRSSVVMWSVDLKDYMANSPGEIRARMLKRSICNGDIILYHGTNRASLDALPDVIDTAKAGGRTGVVISELVT